jgi:prevent-host-death family protein
MAIKAGIRELKSRLSAYLRMVKSGQTVIITERGKVIGYLSPAEAAGLLRRAKGKLPPYEPKVANPGPKLASDIVSEGRNSDYLP